MLAMWSAHVSSYVLKLYIPMDIRPPLLYKRTVLTIYITADDALEPFIISNLVCTLFI